MSEHPAGIHPADFPEPFAGLYRAHLQHLRLQGLRPKTIDAYARAMRRIGEYFSYRVDALTPDDLVEYFNDLKAAHSWSAVKLDLYGFKFFTEHVLRQPWAMPGFIRPPKVSHLPDIVSIEQMQAILSHTRCLSYRVLFFALYSLGLRLGEGLALTVADIDAQRMRLLARAPPPQAAVPQPRRGPPGGLPRCFAPGPRWRAAHPGARGGRAGP